MWHAAFWAAASSAWLFHGFWRSELQPSSLVKSFITALGLLISQSSTSSQDSSLACLCAAYLAVGSKVGLGQAPGKAPAGSPEDLYLPRPPLTSLLPSPTEQEHIVLATGEAASSQQKTAKRPQGGKGMALRGQPGLSM